MQGKALEFGQMRVSTFFESALRDKWHRGSDEVPGPPREASSFILVNTLRAGLSRSLEADVTLPIAWLDAKDEFGEESSAGVGDLLTRVTWNGGTDQWSYGISAGAYWPVGELGSPDLPPTATFSSGTIDPTLGAFLAGPLFNGFGWFTSVNSRLVVGERDDGMSFGSNYTAVLGVARRISKRIDGQLLLTYFALERDKAGTEGAMSSQASGDAMDIMMDNMVEDAGGNWLYLQPFVSANLFARPSYALQASIGARLPLVQSVEGTQLVESPSFSFGFAHTVTF
jgi:hypothetical protein